MTRRTLPALLVLPALLAAGCGHGKKAAVPAPSSSPTPTPTATRGPTGSFLTGLPGEPRGPVAAIKVDNAESARPLHRGLTGAAVVYVEVVEGGDTRLMAVFVGRSTARVGPVRSARDTDVEVLAQYGKVLFGFSGANSGVLAHVKSANLVPLSQEEHGDAYIQDGRRPEAFNFYTSPAQLAAAGGKVPDERDVGFRFGALPARGARVTGHLTAVMTPYSTVGLRWDAGRRGWLIDLTGHAEHLADGATVAPANVLVQFVPLAAGRYVDVLGNNSPDSRSVGTGNAVLFRDGVRLDGRWSRPRADGPTRFTGRDGKDLLLHPGQTWVLLAPVGVALRAG